MFSTLRICGRSLSQTKCFSKPNEINVGRVFLARSIGFGKTSTGRIGVRKTKAELKTNGSPDPTGPVGGILFKPTLFALTTCTCAFSAAAIYKYEDYVDKHKRSVHEHSFSDQFYRFLEGGESKVGWRQWFNQSWTQLSTGEKMAAGCIFINVLVFAAWKSSNPVVQGIMERYFTASIFGQSPCISMLLSTFSHYNWMHLGMNMLCLWSFAPSVVNLLGKEQATALYISAGMTSAWASYVVNVLRASTHASVGASGAILGLAATICTQYPDVKLAIIFLPMFPIAAKYALGGLIAMDTLGVLLRWNLLDHAGHLGGTLFGVGYVAFAHRYILQYQKELLTWWDEHR